MSSGSSRQLSSLSLSFASSHRWDVGFRWVGWDVGFGWGDQHHEMLHVTLWRKLWTEWKRGSWKRRNICIIARIKTVWLLFSSSSSASLRFAGMKGKMFSHPRWRKCFRRHKEVSRGKGNIETSPTCQSESKDGIYFSSHLILCCREEEAKQKSNPCTHQFAPSREAASFTLCWALWESCRHFQSSDLFFSTASWK